MRVLLTVNCLQLHPLALYSSARSEIRGSVGAGDHAYAHQSVIASLPIRGSVGNPDAYYEDLLGAIVDFVNEAPDRPDYISFDVNDDGLLFTHDDD